MLLPLPVSTERAPRAHYFPYPLHSCPTKTSKIFSGISVQIESKLNMLDYKILYINIHFGFRFVVRLFIIKTS